jgi:hypothetical protein
MPVPASGQAPANAAAYPNHRCSGGAVISIGGVQVAAFSVEMLADADVLS